MKRELANLCDFAQVCFKSTLALSAYEFGLEIQNTVYALDSTISIMFERLLWRRSGSESRR